MRVAECRCQLGEEKGKEKRDADKGSCKGSREKGKREAGKKTHANGTSILRRKHRSPVRIIAIDRRHPHKLPLRIRPIRIITDHPSIQHRAVHIQRRILRPRERRVDIHALQERGIEPAQAGEGVVGGRASGADYQVVVLVLAFGDGADGGEGLRFGGCGVEEVEVAAVVGG